MKSIPSEYSSPLSAALHAPCCFLPRGGGEGGSLVSMALVVWPRCSRSSLRLRGEVWLLFVRLSLLNGTPVSPNTGFLHKRIHVAISLCTTNTFRPTPPGLVTQLPVEWRVATYSGLLYKTPPTRVRAIEEQLGRLLFWHSLYVLLIGANWHREAPLFRCIIPPSFARREKKGPNKRSRQKGERVKAMANDIIIASTQASSTIWSLLLVKLLAEGYFNYPFVYISKNFKADEWKKLIL